MSSFTKVLIPNRGEIACRILRTLNRMGMAGVLAHHALDGDSPAVAMAPETVLLRGEPPVSAYLDADQIIAACQTTGADAVHPGFGFLAENADFARKCEAAGITFIGPLPQTMEMMGDKVAARQFCLDNGFPLAPSVTEGENEKDFLNDIEKLGFPVLIKASAGGGGKGMQIVEDKADLPSALALAKAEAARSFGNDRVYAERYVKSARHIEVQILGDHHGRILHLGERECSIQRRFQKIIEESPAPNLSQDLREKIWDIALDIARRAEYRNAGTVEFILTPDNEIYFLEMNTRLQVEHPVTEEVFGLDLVELQIRVARGEALSLDPSQLKAQGHAIELRLYAEDPEGDFLPSTGRLLAFDMAQGEGVRVENGFAPGMRVFSAFDPMLAKLITHGKDRDQALERACRALDQTLVLGVTTNVDYLARILAHADFKAGCIHTGFLPDHENDLEPPPLTHREIKLLLAATALRARAFTDPAFDLPHPHSCIGNWRN